MEITTLEYEEPAGPATQKVTTIKHGGLKITTLEHEEPAGPATPKVTTIEHRGPTTPAIEPRPGPATLKQLPTSLSSYHRKREPGEVRNGEHPSQLGKIRKTRAARTAMRAETGALQGDKNPGSTLRERELRYIKYIKESSPNRQLQFKHITEKEWHSWRDRFQVRCRTHEWDHQRSRFEVALVVRNDAKLLTRNIPVEDHDMARPVRELLDKYEDRFASFANERLRNQALNQGKEGPGRGRRTSRSKGEGRTPTCGSTGRPTGSGNTGCSNNWTRKTPRRHGNTPERGRSSSTGCRTPTKARKETKESRKKVARRKTTRKNLSR
jgi:hypothetical protein